MKRRAIENTINRVGAAEYATALFYQKEAIWPSSDPLELGAFAEQKGRYRTAATLYLLSTRHSQTRRRAVRRLFILAVTALRNMLRKLFRPATTDSQSRN